MPPGLRYWDQHSSQFSVARAVLPTLRGAGAELRDGVGLDDAAARTVAAVCRKAAV